MTLDKIETLSYLGSLIKNAKKKKIIVLVFHARNIQYQTMAYESSVLCNRA